MHKSQYACNRLDRRTEDYQNTRKGARGVEQTPIMHDLDIVVETVFFAFDLRDADFAKFLHDDLVDNGSAVIQKLLACFDLVWVQELKIVKQQQKQQERYQYQYRNCNINLKHTQTRPPTPLRARVEKNEHGR